jgi:hypothetical protein
MQMNHGVQFLFMEYAIKWKIKKLFIKNIYQKIL